jgi:hypothetical protein
MSTGRVLALVGLAGAFLAFVTAILGEKRVEDFGKSVNKWAGGAHLSVAGFGKSVVGGLALLIFCVVVGLIEAFAETGGLPPGTSQKATNEFVHATLNTLKLAGVIVGGLIGLTIALAIILFALWLTARLIEVLPLGPRPVAIIAFAVAVAVFVPNFVTG